MRAAAERLGIRRNSLYERMEREQLDVAPIRAGRAPLVRVLPAEAERIRRGRRRLAVALDADVDDTELLARFIADRFDAWIEDQVAAATRASNP